MTQSCKRNAIPRTSGPPAPAVPKRSFLSVRPVVGFLREVHRTGWSSAIRRLAPRRHPRLALAAASWLPASRRAPVRTFQPAVDGRLEVRMMLSGGTSAGTRFVEASRYLLKHPSARAAYNLKQPPFLDVHAPHFNNVHGFRVKSAVAIQTARGGQAVEVTALDGSHYMIKLSYTSNTIATDTSEGSNGQGGNTSTATADALVSEQNGNYPQPIGTIRAYAMPGGRVGIIVDGSTPNTDLTINPLGEPQKKGYAKSFAYGESGRIHLLNIGQLTVTSGEIGDIEGFQDAELSGPLQITGSSAIDRIAFDAILPGASITTGGDLETLDVLNQIDLSGSGTGITVGRDLDLLNVGGAITLSNGANFQIDRDLGLVSQPPKGTGTGSNVLSLNYTIGLQFDRHRLDSLGRQLHPGRDHHQPGQPLHHQREYLQHDVHRGHHQRLRSIIHQLWLGVPGQSSVHTVACCGVLGSSQHDRPGTDRLRDGHRWCHTLSRSPDRPRSAPDTAAHGPPDALAGSRLTAQLPETQRVPPSRGSGQGTVSS